MKDTNEQETVRHQFDSFCRKVLREKARDLKRADARRAKRELPLSLYVEKAESFGHLDKYPSGQYSFTAAGYAFRIQDGELAEALASLGEEERSVILLAFFLEMNDREISEAIHMPPRTVQRRRTAALRKLQTKLGVLE